MILKELGRVIRNERECGAGSRRRGKEEYQRFKLWAATGVELATSVDFQFFFFPLFARPSLLVWL